MEINVHFRILFIALLKLQSKVHSFERMFEFNQVSWGPNVKEKNMTDLPILY